jgi:hypothetical protein
MSIPIEVQTKVRARYSKLFGELFQMSYLQLYDHVKRNFAGSVRQNLQTNKTPTRKMLMEFAIRKYIERQYREFEEEYANYLLDQERQKNFTTTLGEYVDRSINSIEIGQRGVYQVFTISLYNISLILETRAQHEQYLRMMIDRLKAKNIITDAPITTYGRANFTFPYTYQNNLFITTKGKSVPFLSIETSYEIYTTWEWIQVRTPIPYVWRDVFVALSDIGEINCGLRTICQMVSQEKQELIIKEYGHIRHDQYLSLKELDKIGRTKKLNISIHIYTPISEHLNKPAYIIGRNSGKVVKALVTSNHMTLVPSIRIKECVYIKKHEYIENKTYLTTSDDQIIDATKFQKNNSANLHWVQCSDTANNVQTNTIYKYLRPSTITNDPSDDEQKKYTEMTNPAAILSAHWMKINNFRRTPLHVMDYFKRACKPFGEARFLEEEPLVTEIDMNMSYSSFEFSKEFKGFPRGYFQVRKGFQNEQCDINKLALVQIKNMTPKNEAGVKLLPIVQGLTPDIQVLTAPEYHFYEAYFNIEVTDTVYAYDWNEARLHPLLDKLPPNLDKKQIANQCIGRLVAGGISHDATKKVKVQGESNFIELCRDECINNQLVHTISPANNNELELSAEIPTACSAKFAHVYAYVLAYSKVETLKTIVALQSQNIPIISIKTDAIHIKKESKFFLPNCYPRTERYIPGEWKYQVKKQPLIELSTLTPLTFSTNEISVDYGVPLRPLTVIDGPAGTCKTRNAISTAPNSSLLLQATLTMMQQCREQLNNRIPCYCTAKLSYRINKYYEAKKEKKNEARYGKKLAELVRGRSEIIIDEYAATDSTMIKTITDYCINHGIFLTLIGDSCQKLNAINSQPATKSTLESWGFQFYEDPRNARSPNNDKGHRHDYEYGSFLDTLRGLPFAQASKIVIESKRFNIVDKTPKNALLLTNSWEKIYQHHKNVDGPIRARAIADKTPIILDKQSSDLWLNKRSMRDKLPAANHGLGVNVPRYIGAEATTIEGVQGGTLDCDVCIDLAGMWAPGALYVALTRTRTADKISIIV